MSIDKTTLNRIRIAIQHALCSHPEDDDTNYESMAKAAVDLGIIEKEEDFDTETYTHAPILFEKIWEELGDTLYETPLELFEAWVEDSVGIYRLGDEIEDWSEVQLACTTLQVILSGRNPISNFVFIGRDFVALYKDRSVQDLNKMQRDAFERMQEYSYQKERHEAAKFLGARILGGRKAGKTTISKECRKFIKLYDPETGEYLGPLVKPMTHEEAHGKKPEVEFKIEIDKEAWDATKRELEDFAKELDNATKNTIEIFCRITATTYETFHNHARKYMTSIPTLLPYTVKSAIATVTRISDLSEININVTLLMYTLYNERYKNSILPSTQVDMVFDVVDAMLELKKEGMIQ